MVVELDASYVDCSNCYLNNSVEYTRAQFNDSATKIGSCPATWKKTGDTWKKYWDVSLNKINKNYQSKLVEYTNLYENYVKLNKNTTNNEKIIDSSAITIEKARFHNAEIIKMNKMIEYLVIVYWTLFLLFIGKNIYLKKIDNQKITYSALLIFSPIFLSYTVFFGGLITDFYEDYIKTFFSNMFYPVGVFIYQIIEAITFVFSSVIKFVVDLFVKIINIFPLLFDSFKNLFLNITPDICKITPKPIIYSASDNDGVAIDDDKIELIGTADCCGNDLKEIWTDDLRGVSQKITINGVEYTIKYADPSGCYGKGGPWIMGTGPTGTWQAKDCSSGDILSMQPGAGTLIQTTYGKKLPKCNNAEWENTDISTWPITVTKNGAKLGSKDYEDISKYF